VQQIDERNPSASPYYRQLLDFQAKYSNLKCLVGSTAIKKLGRMSLLPGAGLTRKKASSTRPSIPPFFFHLDPRPNSITRPSWSPCSSACLLCNIWASLENTPWNLADITAPTAIVRRDMHLYPPILPFAFCPSSVLSQRLVPIVPEPARSKGFICLITNDGWWKNTPGYRHHYNFSPVRAIECRRELVRVANTGSQPLSMRKGW